VRTDAGRDSKGATAYATLAIAASYSFAFSLYSYSLIGTCECVRARARVRACERASVRAFVMRACVFIVSRARAGVRACERVWCARAYFLSKHLHVEADDGFPAPLNKACGSGDSEVGGG
jgi:hypothetical protein